MRIQASWLFRPQVQFAEIAITPLTQASTHVRPDPVRTRKLLMRSSEINRLIGKTKQSGLTLVPMKLYFKDGKAKVLIGLGRGKKSHDKRQDIAAREAKRDAERAMAAARRGR